MLTITIKQYDFQLSAPYAEGHPLTADEAKALNGLRAENIRNNMAKIVERECAVLSPGELLSKEVLDGLQATITEYDSRYVFKSKHQPRADAELTQEIKVVLRERAEELARRDGVDLAAASTPDEVLIGYTLEVSVEEVEREARRRLAARARVFASGSIEDLLA